MFTNIKGHPSIAKYQLVFVQEFYDFINLNSEEMEC
jgi:hypothetical protein